MLKHLEPVSPSIQSSLCLNNLMPQETIMLKKVRSDSFANAVVQEIFSVVISNDRVKYCL